jgi:hypothetical protein
VLGRLLESMVVSIKPQICDFVGGFSLISQYYRAMRSQVKR